MRSISVALAIASACCIAGTPALAAPPPSCDRVREALARQPDPAEVATELQTTRARVNACAKLNVALDRLDLQRDQLHRDRRDRGIER